MQSWTSLRKSRAPDLLTAPSFEQRKAQVVGWVEEGIRPAVITEAGSFSRRIDIVYHSTEGTRGCTGPTS
jgi:hypothetical protein